jgi:hypothetical protein
MPPRIGERIAAILLALALPALAAAADTVFLAELDRDEVALGETATLQITLQGPSEPTALELPGEGMKDLEVVNRGQSNQTSVSVINGKLQTTQTRIFQIVLHPTRVGTLTVPSATCLVEGKRYSTRPLQLRVTKDPSGGGTQGRAQAPPGVPQLPGTPRTIDPFQNRQRPATRLRNPERALSVKLELDKKRVWLGEQVTATISIYCPSEVALQNITGSRLPSYDGFWSENLKDQISFQNKVIDNVPYRVYLIRQVALFPTRAGKLTVSPVEFDLITQVPSDDPFDFFPASQKVVRRSEPVSVEVRPLPPGAPPGFQSVNVGDWKLAGSVSEQQVPAGQPVTFRLEASGHGGLRSLTLPKLPAQPGLKLFDPTVKDQVSMDGDRFGGSKVVETVLVPERTGELVLPPLEWSYFDPASGTFQTARTSEVRLTVTPGAAGGAPSVAAGVNTLTAGLRPLHAEGELSKGGSPPWSGPLFALLLLGPVVLYAGMVAGDRLRDRLRSGDGERRVRRAGRKARRRLAAARKLASGGDAAAFHAEVARALIGYAADKLGRSAQGLTRDELARELTQAGAHPPAVAALSSALDACDAGRFGMGAATRGDVLRAAERAMEMLEEAEWRRPREVA